MNIKSNPTFEELNSEIVLGPILGLEGDDLYTVCFISDTGDEDKFCLVISNQDIQPTNKSICRKLNKRYLHRIEFVVDALDESKKIEYEIHRNDGTKIGNSHGESKWMFIVPGKLKVPKIGFASCNGDSKRYALDFNAKDLKMWSELYKEHSQDDINYSFHCLLLSGDQIYADSLWNKVPFFNKYKLNGLFSSYETRDFNFTPSRQAELEAQLKEFYETLYIDSWNHPIISKTLSSIPTIMMWDDHDIFDGWGSHHHDLQDCGIFQCIFKIARHFFEQFQIRTSENKSLICSNSNKGSKFSDNLFSLHCCFRNYEIISLDTRSERTNNRIISKSHYKKIKSYISRNLFKSQFNSNSSQKTIIFQIPVPIAHLNYKERAESLLSKLFRSNFKHSLNDDGLDHWDHSNHTKEQQFLIDFIFNVGNTYNPKYIHIVSGDVHSAGAGRIVKKGKNNNYVVNQFVSSAIVHLPAGKLLQRILNFASTNTSTLSGYRISLNKFGFKENFPLTIYSRNYGYFYKAQNLGLKAYLQLEENKKGYEFDQPSKFIRPIL